MGFYDDRIVRYLSNINENLCLQNRLKILELKIRLVRISNQDEYLNEISNIENKLKTLYQQ
jgi:hypothetical protein